MANADHLAAVHLDGAAFADWRRRHAGIVLDLTDARLSTAFLAGKDLSRADLRGADLSDCSLYHTNLQGARLDDVMAFGTGFEFTDCGGASARHACFRHAILPFSIWRGADLRGADLRNAFAMLADFTGADLRNADLRECRLQFSKLLACRTAKARFQRSVFGFTALASDLSQASGLEFACHEFASNVDLLGIGPRWRRWPRSFLSGLGIADPDDPLRQRRRILLLFAESHRELAERLRTELERIGLSCWLAADRLPMGMDLATLRRLPNKPWLVVLAAKDCLDAAWLPQCTELANSRSRGQLTVRVLTTDPASTRWMRRHGIHVHGTASPGVAAAALAKRLLATRRSGLP